MNQQEQKQTVNSKSILQLALWGALGFGIGGVIAGALLIAFRGVSLWIIIGGLIIMGAIGGASLGLVLYGWKRAWHLSLAGAIGMPLGCIAALYFSWDLQLYWVAYLSWGTILGASLGIAFWSWKRIWFLTLAGAIGFVLAWLIQWGLREWIPIETWAARDIMTFVTWGMVPGASLGAAIGYLEKRRQID